MRAFGVDGRRLASAGRWFAGALVFSSGLRQLETRARRRLGLSARSAHATAGAAL